MKKLIALFCAALFLSVPAAALADHEGGGPTEPGTILYTDYPAANQELQFRAYTWMVGGAEDGVWRTTVDYREVGSDVWKRLDSQWSYTEKQAMQESVRSAHYIETDGYLYQFDANYNPPERATRYRFHESCMENQSINACAVEVLASK